MREVFFSRHRHPTNGIDPQGVAKYRPMRLSRLGVQWTPCPPPPGPDHHWLSVHQEMHPVVPPLLRGRIPESPQPWCPASVPRSEEHTSELQSRENLVCRLLLDTKKHLIA